MEASVRNEAYPRIRIAFVLCHLCLHRESKTGKYRWSVGSKALMLRRITAQKRCGTMVGSRVSEFCPIDCPCQIINSEGNVVRDT